ncbi:MAG TPA: hypothetical protein ENN60_02785 [archaeon]|nr:hypothetical protein [archaeon]
MLAAETVLVTLLGLFLVFWLSIRLRKGGRWVKQRGVVGVGAVLVVFGAVTLSLAFLAQKIDAMAIFLPYTPIYMRVGIGLLVLGAIFIIIGEFRKTLVKETALDIEEEKRRYVERVRSGLTVDEAEKLAKKHVQEATGRNTTLVASKKEFKEWAVYLKDKQDKYYRVIVNQNGKIQEWETMDEIPSYILSP